MSLKSVKNKEVEDLDFRRYSMYLKTVQAAAIRTLSEALKEVLIDVNIHFDDSGFSINSMDRFKTAFIHLKLDSDKFETYYCAKPFPIGLNMISLHKLLKTINNSDIVTLYVEKDNDQCLCIEITNKEKKSRSLSKLKLLDVDDNKIIIPDIMFDCVYNMQCSDFQKNCRDLATIAETVKVYSNGDVFKLEVAGTFAEQSIQIGTSDKTDDFVFIGEYQLKYLNLFCKSSGLCPTIEIY